MSFKHLEKHEFGGVNEIVMWCFVVFRQLVSQSCQTCDRWYE